MNVCCLSLLFSLSHSRDPTLPFAITPSCFSCCPCHTAFIERSLTDRKQWKHLLIVIKRLSAESEYVIIQFPLLPCHHFSLPQCAYVHNARHMSPLTTATICVQIQTVVCITIGMLSYIDDVECYIQAHHFERYVSVYSLISDIWHII